MSPTYECRRTPTIELVTMSCQRTFIFIWILRSKCWTLKDARTMRPKFQDRNQPEWCEWTHERGTYLPPPTAVFELREEYESMDFHGRQLLTLLSSLQVRQIIRFTIARLQEIFLADPEDLWNGRMSDLRGEENHYAPLPLFKKVMWMFKYQAFETAILLDSLSHTTWRTMHLARSSY